jgi:hypothetical protein
MTHIGVLTARPARFVLFALYRAVLESAPPEVRAAKRSGIDRDTSGVGLLLMFASIDPGELPSPRMV